MPSVAPVGFDVAGLHESMPETKAVSFANNGSEFFGTLLDIVNPLQHIPVVSAIYRAVTGDEIAAPAQLIGGALFGGPLGFAAVAAGLLLEDASGNDLEGHALALFSDRDEAPVSIAAAAPAAALAPPPAPQPAPQTAPQIAINPATTDDGAEIIWNAPRVLPSLARAAGAAQGGRSSDTAHNVLAVSEGAGRPVGPNNTSPAASNPAAPRPAWLETAIADARSLQDTAQTGKAAPKVEAQPWLTEAMLEALSKYQALTLERNR